MNSTTTSALDPAAPPPPSAEPPAAPVENFHHYQVLRRPEDGTLWELGRGAMGVTYKAFDVNLRSPVALKVVSPHALTDETARARFVREARAAARLRHRNVASVYHLGQDGQNFFYAMEFVDGETLEALVRRDGPLPANLALRLTLQVARALGAAHREGLVHRDIKPANLMVVSDEDEDGGFLLKVIDFGLARTALGTAAHPAVSASGTGGLSALTHAGFVGTPLFASPEQLEEHEVDIRSDIYSLGVTLWYALTGSPPFTGSLAGIISQHLTREPPWEKLDVPGHTPAAAGPIRRLLKRLLAKDRRDRPADPAVLRRELEETLHALPLDDGDATVADLGPPRRARGRRPARPRRPLPATEAPLANRYELVRPVGEGSAGRVFLARDLAPGSGGRSVALKMLHADLLVTAEDEMALADLVRRARAATHPNLLETFSLERDGGRHFVVQEWLHGFNLITLLRHRGALEAGDVFLLLEDVAAAFDAARAGGLPARRLELGLHQVILHFPPDGKGEAVEPPPVPAGPLVDWPAFRAKIDPLGIGREAAGGDPLLTWAGDQTLVPLPSAPPTPPRPLTRDTRSGLVGENTVAGDADELDLAAGLRALGGLVYTLLGGSAAALADAGPAARYVSLPALSERANAALRRGCLPAADGTAGFRSAREFADALRGGRPAVPSSPARPVDEPPPSPVVPVQPRPTQRVPTVVVPAVDLPKLGEKPARTATTGPGRSRASANRDFTVVPASRDLADGEGSSAASTSIAHLFDDPPRSPGRSPVLAALLALTLLAVAGGWFGARYFQPAASRATSDAPSAAEPRPATFPPRKTPAVPASSRPRTDPEPLVAKSAPTPPPLPRVTSATPGPEETRPAATAATTVLVPPRRPTESPLPTARREPSPATVRPAPPRAAATSSAPMTPSTPGATPVHRVRVNLSSEPGGAELTVGEQSLGVAPQTVTLLPGEYTVRARYGDWPEATRLVRVPSEGVESVDARIKLSPRTAANAPTLNVPENPVPTLPPVPDETGGTGGRNSSRRDPTTENISPESQALPAIPVPQESPGEGGA